MKENDVDFEKIMIEERRKLNPGDVDPGRDKPLNPPLVAPVGAPVGQEVGGPAAADKEGVLDLVKKMLMGGEGAKGGLGTQEADQQIGQPNADEKAATAFRDLQSDKVPDAAQKTDVPEKAPPAADNAFRKVF